MPISPPQPKSLQSLRTSSALVQCPACSHVGHSKVKRESGVLSYMYGSALAIFCLWWIPFVIPSIKDSVHYCPSCGIRLASWYPSSKYLAVEPGMGAAAVTTNSLQLSPLGPSLVPGRKKSSTAPVLVTLLFKEYRSKKKDRSGWDIESASGSPAQLKYSVRGNPAGVSNIPKYHSPTSTGDYNPLFSDFQVYHTDPVTTQFSQVSDISYSQNNWNIRLRLYDRQRAAINLGGRARELIMEQPVIQAVKAIVHFESSRGLLRWEKPRRVRGFGKGRPLVDRWGRLCALYVKKKASSSQLIIFRPVGAENQSSVVVHDSDMELWISEILTATVAVLPHEQRRQAWSDHTYPGTYYDYSGS